MTTTTRRQKRRLQCSAARLAKVEEKRKPPASRIFWRFRELVPDLVAVSDDKLHGLMQSDRSCHTAGQSLLFQRTSDTMPCGSCNGSIANA